MWYADVCICMIALIIFAKVPFLHCIISFSSLATWMHSSTLVIITSDLLIFPKYFRNHFIEIQTKNECNLLLLNNKGSSGFSWVPLTELNKTFDEILIRPHKAWYLGNIKCDLSFYITLTLMSLVLNEIISLNVCTLMMCLSWK